MDRKDIVLMLLWGVGAVTGIGLACDPCGRSCGDQQQIKVREVREKFKRCEEQCERLIYEECCRVQCELGQKTAGLSNGWEQKREKRWEEKLDECHADLEKCWDRK